MLPFCAYIAEAREQPSSSSKGASQQFKGWTMVNAKKQKQYCRKSDERRGARDGSDKAKRGKQSRLE